MINILKSNFENLREELTPCFEALERASQQLSTDFYLIGAQARDVWLKHLNLYELRITTDVDFAIYIRTHEQFQELSEYLCTVESFHREPNAPYRFRFGGANGLIVDLLPFGGIEQDGSVWLKDPPMELSVFGMREVTAQAETIDEVWNIVTLPGLVVLKLIAFSEKPEREKDIRDVELILRHYETFAVEAFGEPAYDDLSAEHGGFDAVAARILGRQIGRLLAGQTAIRDRILTVIDKRFQGFSEEEINTMYQNRDQNYSEAVLFKLLLECSVGIKDIHG